MPLTKVRGAGIGDSTTALDVKSLGVDFTSDTYQVVKIQTDSNDDGSNDDAILQFTNGSSKTVKGEIRFDESESMFEIGQGDNQGHIKIDSNGKVGIGTTTNRMVLTVAGSNSTSVGLGIDNSSGGGTLDFACLGSGYSAHGASAGEVWWYSPDNMNIGGATGNTNSIKFLGGGTERARINQYGQASFRYGIAFRPLAHYILTTSYQDICQIDTSSGDAGRGFILAVSSENNYHQHWNIQVSQNDISTHFFGGDSGHTHSKDVQWRKNNSHIQAKRSLSTGRALALYCAAGACIIDFDE